MYSNCNANNGKTWNPPEINLLGLDKFVGGQVATMKPDGSGYEFPVVFIGPDGERIEVPVDINKDDLKGVICAINTNPPPPIAAAIGQNENGEWETYGANPPGSLEINGDKAYWDHGNGLIVETTLERNGNTVEQTVNAYIVNGIRYEREEPYTNPKRFSHTDEFTSSIFYNYVNRF